MNTLKWFGVVAAALAVGYLLGRNTGGKWRMAGTGSSQVMYNEHTGELVARDDGVWVQAETQKDSLGEELDQVKLDLRLTIEALVDANESSDAYRTQWVKVQEELAVEKEKVRKAGLWATVLNETMLFNRESALSWKWEFNRLLANLKASGHKIHPFTGTFAFGPSDEDGSILKSEANRKYDPDRHLMEGALKYGGQDRILTGADPFTDLDLITR